MEIKIVEETIDVLRDYGQIPISFQVESRLRLEPVNNGLGGIILSEEQVEPAYIKDYDVFEDPMSWLKRWDISHWGVLSGYHDKKRIGGAVVAYDTEGVWMLEGRKDLAVLWDIRVHPDFRRAGIGTKLFQSAVAWAEGKGCKTLKAETQNINVPACRLYAKHGCKLEAINLHAYTECPDEVELIWYKEL